MSLDFDSRYPRFHFGEYDRVTVNGEAFRFLQKVHDAYVLMPSEGAGLARTFPFKYLNQLNSAGKVSHEREYFLPPGLRTKSVRNDGATSMAHLTRKQKARQDLRHAMVMGFQEAEARGEVTRTEASVMPKRPMICEYALEYLQKTVNPAVAAKHHKPKGGKTKVTITPVHAGTLLRWVRSFEAKGKAGLVDRLTRCGDRLSRFTAEENELMMAEVRKSYLTLNRKTVVATVVDVQIAFRAENARRAETGGVPLSVPGRQAIRACIGSLDPLHVALARLGPQEAIKRHRPVKKGPEVSRPLERVEIDEWDIDLITIMARAELLPLFTAEELEAIGLTGKKARWCIAVAIDCRTRVILGMKLTNNPKTSAATECLRLVVSDKGEISDATGAAARWSQYGVPELLVADNGGAFKSILFTDCCNDLGITLERTIAGLAAMRGKIERVFQTCAKGLLPRLSGRTFSNVIERGKHPAEDRACLGPEDLCFALVRWIVDIYHNTPHAGIELRTPLQQWEKDHADGNFPLHAAPDARSKRLAFGIPDSRMATREGVTVMGVRYNSEALARFVAGVGPRKIDLRWDPEDIGRVEVCMDGLWQEVGAVHDGFEGLHAQVWVTARRAMRARCPKRRRWEQNTVTEAIEAITAMNTHRSLQFKLIDQEWNEARVKNFEDSLFDTFKVTVTAPETDAGVKAYGVSLPSNPPEGPEPSPDDADVTEPVPESTVEDVAAPHASLREDDAWDLGGGEN